MGYNLLKNWVYWGYNPLTNLLLTSRDIQVETFLLDPFSLYIICPGKPREKPLGCRNQMSEEYDTRYTRT